MSQIYAIGSLGEARAYLDHPVLGPRLRDCAAALLASRAGGGRDPRLDRRGQAPLVDDAVPAGGARRAAFQAVLDRFYAGRPDAATDALLGSPSREARRGRWADRFRRPPSPAPYAPRSCPDRP